MLVDSHCHLDRLKPTSGDAQSSLAGDGVQQAIDAARHQGVQHFLCVAVDMTTFPHMQRTVDPFPDVSLTAGVHPCDLPADALDLATLRDQLQQPRVVGLGETGLDYFHGKTAVDRARQQDAFAQQIALARELDLPMVIHCRSAWEDCVGMLKNQGVTGVFHCFTGDVNQAREALDLGFYVSFSGVVTFKSAQENAKAAAFVPTDRFLVETDSPYLAPVPYRGQPNVPAYVREVAAYVASLRGQSLTAVAEATTTNFARLFPRAVLSPL